MNRREKIGIRNTNTSTKTNISKNTSRITNTITNANTKYLEQKRENIWIWCWSHFFSWLAVMQACSLPESYTENSWQKKKRIASKLKFSLDLIYKFHSNASVQALFDLVARVFFLGKEYMVALSQVLISRKWCNCLYLCCLLPNHANQLSHFKWPKGYL